MLCLPAGDGGDTLHLDAGSTAFLVGCVLAPGPPGRPEVGCGSGRPGQRIGGTGAASEHGFTAGSVAAASPVRAGPRAEFAIDGPAGAAVWLALAGRRAPVFLADCHGTLHPDANAASILPLGTIPIGGRLTFAVSVPGLGTEAVAVVAQAGLLQPSVGCSMAAPTDVVLLHPRF